MLPKPHICPECGAEIYGTLCVNCDFVTLWSEPDYDEIDESGTNGDDEY